MLSFNYIRKDLWQDTRNNFYSGGHLFRPYLAHPAGADPLDQHDYTRFLLGLMLAFEPKEPGIMLRKPRDPDTPILTSELIIRIFLWAPCY